MSSNLFFRPLLRHVYLRLWEQEIINRFYCRQNICAVLLFFTCEEYCTLYQSAHKCTGKRCLKGGANGIGLPVQLKYSCLHKYLLTTSLFPGGPNSGKYPIAPDEKSYKTVHYNSSRGNIQPVEGQNSKRTENVHETFQRIENMLPALVYKLAEIYSYPWTFY